MKHLAASFLIGWIASLGLVRAEAAQAVEPVSFSYKDWVLQCDNTGTCRAAGYQEEEGDSDPVSLMLSRAAGPGTPVQIELQVYSDNETHGPYKFTVGRLNIGGLEGDSLLIPEARVPELLRELLRSAWGVVNSPARKAPWTLSLAGLNAVLLKMDEAQGRLDTPAALVRKGSREESSVPAAVAAPRLVAVKPVATRQSDAGLAKPLLAAIDPGVVAEQCNSPDIDPASAVVTRLAAHEVLLALPCSMGAYNGTQLLWVARDRPPYKPVLQEANGDFDAKTGTVFSSMKGRGIGDCWSNQSWQLTAQGFVLSGSSNTGLCRGFPGGAWPMPDYVTR